MLHMRTKQFPLGRVGKHLHRNRVKAARQRFKLRRHHEDRCLRLRESLPLEDSIDNEPDAAPSEAQPVLTAEGKKGPTFFVDISPSWMKRVLSADPVGVDPRMQPTKEKADLAVVRKILGTLKTFPTQKPPGICIEELQHRGFPVGIRPR